MDSLGSIPQVPITIKRGGIFYLPFIYKDSEGVLVDLAGYGAKMQIWLSQTAIGTSILDIGTYGTNTAYGTIAINTTTAQVDILLQSAFTITFPNICTKGWYEFHFFDSNGNDIPLFEGPVAFEPGGIR